MRGVKARNSIGSSSRRSWLAGLVWLAAGAGFAAAPACVAQESKPPDTPAATSAQAPETEARPAKDSKQQKAAAAESERRKLITDQSAQLLEMVLALKAEVDKTTKDTLSLNVIKKADEIEKLAKQVKEKMKQNSGN